MRSALLAIVWVLVGSAAYAQDEPEMDHGDGTVFNNIRTEVDYTPQDDGLFSWDVSGWIGGDSERMWVRSEGEIEGGHTSAAEAQIFYGWNVDPFWDVLIGARQDFEPRSTTYLAASLVGLAKYDFETEASLYLSHRGDVSARLEQSFDFLLTQRLIAEAHGQVDVFPQDVSELGVGAGISQVELGLQLRYEITRKFAPYVDAVWERKLGETSSIARQAGEDPEQATVRVGVRLWF